MVNRTGLPSFIVTLASFFTLRGVMLVISKRLVGKVQVDKITEQKGAKFFKGWIAHEWKFTEFAVATSCSWRSSLPAAQHSSMACSNNRSFGARP